MPATMDRALTNAAQLEDVFVSYLSMGMLNDHTRSEMPFCFGTCSDLALPLSCLSEEDENLELDILSKRREMKDVRG